MNMADKTQREKNEIVMVGRRALSVGGVEEVINFDEECVRLKSVDGEMIVEGEGIKIDTLDTDRGVVKLNGRINGIYYASEPDTSKKGFFGKLMR